ncbi:MAG: hypothetical protein V8R07_02325 [Bacteroides fragilis]
MIIVDSVTKIPTVYEVEAGIINQPPACADDLKAFTGDRDHTAGKNMIPANFVRYTPKC